MAQVTHKQFSLLGVQLTAEVGTERADRIKRSLWWRYLARPSLRALRRERVATGNGHVAAVPSYAPPAPSAPDTPEARTILDQIRDIEWYHSIDLPHGVSTPGYVDHRAQVPLYGLPDDLRGLRALDVATYDGFWAFELARRGAAVTAIDLESMEQCDFPRRFRHLGPAAGTQQPLGTAFYAARELLGLAVDRQTISVYDLSPTRVGTFDLVFLSDLLLHLRDPALALENVRGVTGDGGFAIVAEPYNERLDAQFPDAPVSQFGFPEAVGWWQLSANTIKTMMWAAGFDRIEEVSRFYLTCQAKVPLKKVVLKGYPA